MKVRYFTTMLIQLNTDLPHFPPDRPGQQVTSLADDDIKDIMYHTMPNMWKEKKVEQGYDYLDGHINVIAEFFETNIESLEKSIPPSVPSRNNRKSKKGIKKRKAMTFNNSEDKDSDRGQKGTKFCQYHGTCGHTTDQGTTLKALVKQVKQKRSKHFDNNKRFTMHEVKAIVQKQIKKALKQKQRKRTEELQTFKKMSVSDSDQESMNNSSSEEGEV